MAVKTYYPLSTKDGNFYGCSETQPSGAAAFIPSWTVGKIASGNSSEFNASARQATGSFSSQTTTPKPASFVTTSSANAFKSDLALTGTFANSAWTFSWLAGSQATGVSSGRLRMRVFKSANASGSGATELTSSTLVGTTASVGAGNSAVTVTWSPGATITLSNEYLFFVLAWEITTAGGSNSSVIDLESGGNSGGFTTFTTPDFSAAAARSLVVPDPRSSRRGALPQRILR